MIFIGVNVSIFKIPRHFVSRKIIKHCNCDFYILTSSNVARQLQDATLAKQPQDATLLPLAPVLNTLLIPTLPTQYVTDSTTI
jgi:hypothetical protein